MESSYSYVYCQKNFNRDDNLKRHMKSQHGWGNKQNTDGDQKSEMDLPLSQFALRHPFTLMVAASTVGGKMWFVKDLLQNRVVDVSCTTANHLDLWSVATTLVCRDAENHTRYRVCERHPSKH